MSFSLAERPGFGWIEVAFGIAIAHLCAARLYPTHAWITCVAWIALYLVAFIVALQERSRSSTTGRWRWGLLALSFCLAICSFICILSAEIDPSVSHIAMWTNDLLRIWRLLPILLTLCMPEVLDYSTNRVLDAIQTILIALIFFAIYSPGLFQADGHIMQLGGLLVNQYVYSQSIIIMLLSVLAVFTAQTAESRFFYRALALYLCVGVPLNIWTNHVLINTWRVDPASAFFVFSDVPLIVFVLAIPLLRALSKGSHAGRRLLMLRLGASIFLPLYGIVASMLLAIPGHHPVLGATAGIVCLGIYGFRSAYGQLRLLSVQWNLEAANQQLERLSQRDPLTGLYNRRWFSEALMQEWRRAQRGNIPLSLLIIDIDHFKLYNDKLGHAKGDVCLEAVTQVLSAQLRRGIDALVRYGGEEFIALLPHTDAEGARVVANKMARMLYEVQIPHPGSPFKVVTISIGGATCLSAKHEMAAQELLEAADSALYDAKAHGRNRVEIVHFDENHRNTSTTIFNL